MKEAFLSMVEEHQAIVHKICRMYRDTPEDQEDLFQEIVYQLWKAFPDFREEAKVSTWMYRIALNTALATFRKNTIALDFRATITDELHPAASEAASENEERMYAALRTLTPAEKAIISLYLDDFSHHEIGQITGISENYVGVRIHRIKDKLKTILNP